MRLEIDHQSVRRPAVGILAVVIAFIFGFPLYWMTISSVKPISALTNYPPQLIPQDVTMSNYARLFTETAYLTWLKNSMIVTSGTILLTVILATLAGYSLTRYDIPFKKTMARMFIFGYMFPPMMLSIPYFILFKELGLLDSYLGLMLAHTSISLPFAVWLMWQYFQTVPIEWEESAWICGSSRLRSMVEVALPSALPGMVASAIFTFGISWNDFTFALILLSDPDKKVLTLGLQNFIATNEIYWGLLMTGGVLLVLPPFLLVFFLNKYVLEGFSVGGFD